MTRDRRPDPPVAVVRVSHGNFDPARLPEVREMSVSISEPDEDAQQMSRLR